MIYEYRGMKFEIETPDKVLEAVATMGTATTMEEYDEARELVEGFDAETATLLPGLHQWYRG